MINHIIDFSIRNKLTIGLFVLMLIGAGIWSFTKVPIDAVPDITNNQVQVITQAPNLGTEDIEQFVTYPVEIALSNLPGIVEIRSVSRFGLSLVTVVFEDDMGTYLPRQLVAERLSSVQDEIPKGFGHPKMGPITTGLGEIFQYTLSVDEQNEDDYTITELRTIQDWIIRRQMAMVPGVVEVNGFGGKIKQYEVAVDPNQLKSMSITISDVFQALEANNQNTGGAYIEKNHKANFIRGEGLVRDIDDIKNIVIKTVNNIPIRIKDVARVHYGHAIRYGAFTKNGKGEAVGGIIMMLKGANSNEVIRNVKARMADIEQSLPQGVHIEPFLDRSKLIAETTGTVRSNLLEGGLIVIFVLVLLLGNWRGGLIVASTIPLSLLFAFILMHIFDVWANLMSLGAIDFGIIVDGAVIIVEGTVFMLTQQIRKNGTLTAQQRDQVTASSSKKMMNAAFFGQLIVLVVFLPILTLEGIEGKMFKPMALTFSFAMIGAMILCLTYVPMISALFIRVPKSQQLSWSERLIRWLENRYQQGLELVLRKSALFLAIAVALFITTIFAFQKLGGEFIPQLDEGDIAFHIILEPGSSLSESIATSTKVEQILLENFPEIQSAQSRFGVADVPTDPMPMDLADCFVILKPKSEWVTANTKEELIEKMKEKLNILPGISYEFTQPIEMRFNELLTGVREDIAIKLYGEDLQVLAHKANEIGSLVSDIHGVADMRVEATTGLPQMTVHYNRNLVAQYELNIEDLNHTVKTAFAGSKAGVIFEGEKRFDLMVRLDTTHRKSIKDLRQLYIHLPNGTQIPLEEVAEISYQPGPMQISRDNTNRRTYVGINVRGRDVESLVEAIQQKLNDELELPTGYYIRYGGAFENFERATQRLQIVVPVALALIFILIFFALRSFRQTLMIYVAIPLASIGGVFSLWIRGMDFSISAGVGFIVLFGVAVLNGLVMISGFNELKENRELDLKSRINEGAKRRVRPILLTALTDILGFMPMAISTSAGAEVQRPLATVVIGGLITSTLLTLFILPVLYRWLESRGSAMPGKAVTVSILTAVLCFAANHGNAQSDTSSKAISIEEATEKAKSNYPALNSARLRTEQQLQLKKTAWDLGETQLFTNGSEINRSDDILGVQTIAGIQVQQIDLFGISPNSKLYNSKAELSVATENITEARIEREVKTAYARLFVNRKRIYSLQQLDSLFHQYQRAEKTKLETEATSKLEYLAAVNQAKQFAIRVSEARHDHESLIASFNKWFASDTTFTPISEPAREWMSPWNLDNIDLDLHPEMHLAAQKINVAEHEVKAQKKQYLPQFMAGYGWQAVQGQSGFHQYQAGIVFPISLLPLTGRIRAAQLEVEVARASMRQEQLELNAAYQSALEQYKKWQESWQFYQHEALPLATSQLEGAQLAYETGDIEFTKFVQHARQSLQMELNAWDALEQLYISIYQLEYFYQNAK